VETLLERARRFALLESWCDLPPPEPLPEWEIDPAKASRADAENAAASAARILELGSRPTSALLRVLEERFGVKVFYEPMGEDGSAASVRGQFGAAMLINASEAPWRRNFNLAHELFHLLTWTFVDRRLAVEGPEAPWSEEIEKLANVFASRLLLPADPLLAEFGARLHDHKIKYLDIVELAREFDVSSSALVWRLVTLRRLDKDDAEALLQNSVFQAIDRGTMADRWGPIPPALPDRFVRLAHLAYQKGRISRAKLAEFLEMSLSRLDPGIEIEGASAAEASVVTA
jgi:Zn-dependent peptidase ImmA (M78 family)